MKIRMSAEQAAGLFEFAMLQDLDPTSMEPMKVSRDSAEPKLVDGRPVFRVRVTALDRESGREMDAENQEQAADQDRAHFRSEAGGSGDGHALCDQR